MNASLTNEQKAMLESALEGALAVIAAAQAGLDTVRDDEYVVCSANVWDRRVLRVNASTGQWIVNPSLEPQRFQLAKATTRARIVNRDMQQQGSEEVLEAMPARRWWAKQLKTGQDAERSIRAILNGMNAE